jgi:hypothetical protein
MPTGLYFELKYLPFTFTLKLPYNDPLLLRNNLFSPFQNLIKEFDGTYFSLSPQTFTLLIF